MNSKSNWNPNIPSWMPSHPEPLWKSAPPSTPTSCCVRFGLLCGCVFVLRARARVCVCVCVCAYVLLSVRLKRLDNTCMRPHLPPSPRQPRRWFLFDPNRNVPIGSGTKLFDPQCRACSPRRHLCKCIVICHTSELHSPEIKGSHRDNPFRRPETH